jgi:hypothetical protein
MMGKTGASMIALGIMGLILIWKGITGDVMKTKPENDRITRWIYVVGGIALLFPVLFDALRSPARRALFGL